MLFESEDEALRSAVEGCWGDIFTFKGGLRGDIESCAEAREEVTTDSGESVDADSWDTFRDTADTLTAAYGTKWNGNAPADNGSLFVYKEEPVAFNSKRAGDDSMEELCPTLCAMPHKDSKQNGGGHPPMVAYPIQEPGHGEHRTEGAAGVDQDGEPMYTLQANSPHGVAVGLAHCAPEAPCLSASGAGMSRTGNERTECEMVVVEGVMGGCFALFNSRC